jgi:hypothetical protein
LVLEKGHVDAWPTVLACVEAQIEDGAIPFPSPCSQGVVAESMGQVHLFVEDVGSGGQRGVVVVFQAILRAPLKLLLVVVAHYRINGYLCFKDFESAPIGAELFKGEVAVGRHTRIKGTPQW